MAREKKSRKMRKTVGPECKDKFELEYESLMTEFEEKFFSSLNAKDLGAIKCRGCRKFVFPPAEVCPFCGKKSEKSERTKIPNEGRVFSQTLVYYPCHFLSDYGSPVSIVALRISQTDTFVLAPSRNTTIYLGDKVKIFVKAKNRRNDISDLEIEKL